MKIIVGLGNPGNKYLLTRHNVGFLFLEYLKYVFKAEDFQEKTKFKANISEVSVGDEKFVLVKPTTYMNLSGETLVALKNFYKTEDEDFLVCYDDIDLNFGDFRYRDKGSAGTHNGMRSVIELMGTQKIPRLRFGVERDDRKAELKAFVLAKFTENELDALPKIFKEAAKDVFKELID